MPNVEDSNDMLTKEEIIEIAKTSSITPDLPMEQITIYYDAGNVEWQKVFGSLKKEDPDSAKWIQSNNR